MFVQREKDPWNDPSTPWLFLRGAGDRMFWPVVGLVLTMPIHGLPTPAAAVLSKLPSSSRNDTC